jgi:hypothetical protein
MSFVRLPQDAFDTFSVIARPSRFFASSSSGLTGSVKVYQRSSEVEKDPGVFVDKFNDDTLEGRLKEARENAKSSSDVSQAMSDYMDAVNDSAVSGRFSKSVEVLRFEPSFRFTSDTLRKSVVRNVMYPYYRASYHGLNWGFTNYLSLHFPDNIGPTSASIVYPSSGNFGYVPQTAFTLETYVKPSYTSQEYPAGTIMHASSAFALSIVSGSGKGPWGEVASFRIMLQLSHSADIAPSEIDLSLNNNTRSSPGDLVFLSDDVLQFNHWHHVVARWGPENNGRTGSFYIDGQIAGTFYIPSGSVTSGTNEAVFLGNYYEGQTTLLNRPSGFFNYDAVVNEGVTDRFNASPGDLEQPTQYDLRHPFRGEIHETKIWNKFLGTSEILTGAMHGTNSGSAGLLFYVPPFFVRETPERFVLQTPFQGTTTVTDDPYNVSLSFGVGGHLINLENHVREMVNGTYPRLLHLTASSYDLATTANQEANYYLYGNDEIKRRNLTILPCDNGKMLSDFSFLISGSVIGASGSATEKFVTDLGSPDISFVNLTEMIVTSSLFPGLVQDSDILDSIMGSSPEDPGVAPGSVLTIFQRTRDNSSNAVTFFDASNLFYGGRIHPGSYTVCDTSFTGSDGTLAIRLRDNGMGGLYRADASSSHSAKSTVGACLYSEGIATVTSPYLGEVFGQQSFEVEMRGEHVLPVLEVQAIAPAWTLTSSSNPTYKSLYSSDYSNDSVPGFVYINAINFHDENLNVVAKASFAQPIVKRPNDRIMFRTKFDY